MEFNKPAPLKMTGNLSQNFKFFKQQIEIYMTATETDEKSKTIQVARLLNLMGTDALKVYNTLVIDKPDTEVSQILSRLEKYCSPRTNEIMSHYKFFTSKQIDENFDVYLTRLKELVKPCNFGTLENKLLKTQIVLGIRCRDTLERLLREDMTLDQVVVFCQSVEAAEKNCKELENKSEVHHIAKQTPASSKQKTTINNCTRCGKTHLINKCFAFGKICNKCKRMNHFSNLCKLNIGTSKQNNINNKKGKSYKQHLITTVNSSVDSETGSNDEDLVFSINQIEIKETDTKKWSQIINVNDTQINFQIDTGAETNILPYRVFKKINTKKIIQPTKIKIESYGGYKLTPKGIIILECRVKEIVKDVRFVIIEHPNCIPILGLSSCIDFNLVQRINRLQISKTAELDNFISKNKCVFEGLGTFPDLVQIKLVDEAVPKANPPRRVPLAVKPRLEQL